MDNTVLVLEGCHTAEMGQQWEHHWYRYKCSVQLKQSMLCMKPITHMCQGELCRVQHPQFIVFRPQLGMGHGGTGQQKSAKTDVAAGVCQRLLPAAPAAPLPFTSSTELLWR